MYTDRYPDSTHTDFQTDPIVISMFKNYAKMVHDPKLK